MSTKKPALIAWAFDFIWKKDLEVAEGVEPSSPNGLSRTIFDCHPWQALSEFGSDISMIQFF